MKNKAYRRNWRKYGRKVDKDRFRSFTSLFRGQNFLSFFQTTPENQQSDRRIWHNDILLKRCNRLYEVFVQLLEIAYPFVAIVVFSPCLTIWVQN